MARSEAGLEAGLEASIEASIEADRPPRRVLVRVAYTAPVPRSVSYGALLALVACGAATPTLLGPSEAEREELERTLTEMETELASKNAEIERLKEELEASKLKISQLEVCACACM